MKRLAVSRILAALFLTGIGLVALEDVLRLDKSAIMLLLASVPLGSS